MLKRFFISFAGGMAAIWLSVILLFVLAIFMIASTAFTGGTTAKLERHSVLRINLKGNIDERPSMPSLPEVIANNGKMNATTGLNDIVMALDAAAGDKEIDGVFIDASGAKSGIATRFSIIQAIKRFKESGKWVIAYGDSYDQGDYLVATAADSIFVNPQGMINIGGLSATTPYFKGLFDKMGIDVQVLKVGTYKSAVEPFTLDGMSEASREQQESYLNDIWSTLKSQIAQARGVDTTAVNSWADSICATWTAQQLIKHKVADKSVYRHYVLELIARLTGNEKVEKVNYISPADYVSIKGLPKHNGSDKIAVLYAVGDIVDEGKGGIVAKDMVPQIEKIINDKNVAGLVLRVNSGGGSAFASEQIWEALERFKATGRPLYVSMGDVAASGGYYISCGADKIYAQPQTLTGSIGIFGLIPCAQHLLNDKLGINTGTVSTNPAGAPINIAEPLSPAQKNAYQRMINNGYETFVGRCAKGRNKTVAQIKAIAEGRVWDGQQALKIGLVDHMGTLEDAINAMASKLKLDKYTIAELPSLKASFFDQFMEMQEQAKEKTLREQFGESYNWYKTIDQITRMSPIQCRMPFVEIR